MRIKIYSTISQAKLYHKQILKISSVCSIKHNRTLFHFVSTSLRVMCIFSRWNVQYKRRSALHQCGIFIVGISKLFRTAGSSRTNHSALPHLSDFFVFAIFFSPHFFVLFVFLIPKKACKSCDKLCSGRDGMALPQREWKRRREN